MTHLATSSVLRRSPDPAAHTPGEQLQHGSVFDATMTTLAALDGRYLKVPPAFCAMLGYTESELLARRCMDVTHADDAEIDARACRELIRGGARTYDLEKRYVRKDGRVVWVYLNCSVARDAENRPLHFVAHVYDITQRKLAEAALRESEERFREMADAIGAVLWMADVDLGRVYASAAYERVWGRSRAALSENPGAFIESIHEEDRARVSACLLSPQHPAELEYRVVRPDGSVRWVKDRLFPVRDETGRVRRVTGLAEDVTEHKRAGALEPERNNLRNAVHAHEWLLGVIGHELRTPLAASRAMAEFLLSQCVDGSDEFRHFLQSIHDQIVRMSSMVNDLLEVARLSSGTARWNWSRFAVAPVCDGALDSVRPLVDVSRVELRLDSDEPDREMLGDADAVRRLVLNLVNNAYKHTPSGSIHVAVRHVSRDGAGWVEIAVRDTGEGISPETAARLGEPFALNSGIIGARHVDGSGLGLAICKGIVAAHGGTLSVESQLGRGSTFTALIRADLPQPVQDTGGVQIVHHSHPCRV